MSRRWARWLLKAYPAGWQSEYGPELEELLCRQRIQISSCLNVIWSGVRERARDPLTGFVLYACFGGALIFLSSLIFAEPLWSSLTLAVSRTLQSKGIRPSSLIQSGPWDALLVVQFGIPLCVTCLLAAPWILIRLQIFSLRCKKLETSQQAGDVVVGSSIAFAISSLFSVQLLRDRSIAGLLQVYPDLENAPLVSVQHYFKLFAVITVGLMVLLQIPVIAFVVRQSIRRLLFTSK